MNRNHWNTITLDDSVPEELLFRMVDASSALVVKGVPKQERERLADNKEKSP